MERPAYIGCNSHARRGGAPPTVPRPPRRWGVARARSPRIPRVPPRRASTPARLPFRSTPARGCGVCTPPPPSADLFPSALQACARRWGAGWGGRAPGAGPADSARGGAGRGGRPGPPPPPAGCALRPWGPLASVAMAAGRRGRRSAGPRLWIWCHAAGRGPSHHRRHHRRQRTSFAPQGI